MLVKQGKWFDVISIMVLIIAITVSYKLWTKWLLTSNYFIVQLTATIFLLHVSFE